MYQQYFKRSFDILLSLVFAILLSWVFVLILVMYVVSLQFPIFFFQERIGLANKPFVMFKFRTLSTYTDLSLESRRFWLGDILRFLSLDELPQLGNIIRGEMSFIGPRPLPVEYLRLMNEQQLMRHTVRPGITGWTQVNSRHSLSWKEKFELDDFYIKNISFRFDLLILFKTIFLLLTPRKDVSLIEEKFKGN